MNDRQLLSFIKIVETGSFSKAAKDSFISVPAMVQQIDRLEEDLGFRLLLRSNQGVRLTDQGKIFYDAVTTDGDDAKSGRPSSSGAR